MADYISSYTGAQIDALLGEVVAGRGSDASLDARFDSIETTIGNINTVLEEVL